MSVVANTLLNAANAWASLRNKKVAYIIGEHEIEQQFVNPDKMTRYHWDDEMYGGECMYIKGQANPIRPRVNEEDDEVEVITSDKYQAFMQQSVISEAFSTGGQDMPLQLYIQGAILVAMIFGLVMYFG